MFIDCEKCGKRLVERLPNGLWRFKFGQSGGKPIVDIEIHGSMRFVCLRKTCRHTNTLHYFPPSNNNPEME